MGDDISILFGLALMAGVGWLCIIFYWGRVLSCALLMILWGGFSVIGPIYVAAKRIEEGEFFMAVLTVVVSMVIIVPFGMAFKAALIWLKYQHKTDGIIQPWNER